MHFTPTDWIFAYFSFLGVGKLILSGVSYHRCHWHRGKNLSAVLLTPAINFRLFGYFWMVSMTLGKNVIASVDKLFICVNDTAENFFIGNKLYWRSRSVVSAKLRTAFQEQGDHCNKTTMSPQWNTWGPRGLWFMKKTESWKSRVWLPLKGLSGNNKKGSKVVSI